MTSRVPFAKRALLALLVSLAFLIVTAMFGVIAGAQRLPFEAIFTADSESPEHAILLLRASRVALAGIVGAALGAVGSSLQGLLRNPLADPYVLGTSGGAALTATLALALRLASPQSLSLPLFAFAGALLSTVLVHAIARRRADTTSVLLAGIVVNAFAAAAITLVKVLLAPNETQKILYWLVGSVGYERASTVIALGIYVAFGVVGLVLLAGKINALGLGDDTATSLGVHVPQTRLLVFIFTAMLVGGVVSIAGLIGFVGLVVPHAVRLLVGADQRIALPASALSGGAFLILSDAIARTLFSSLGTELPVGAITAMIGCPVFLILLLRSRNAVI